MAKKDILRFFQELAGKSLVDDIKTTEKALSRYHDKSGGRKRRRLLPWNGPGNVKRVSAYERGIRVDCEQGSVELQWVAADCLRVRLCPGTKNADFAPPFSYAVSKVDWPQVKIEAVDHPAVVEMQSSTMICRVEKRPFRLHLENSGRELICTDSAGMQWREDGTVRLSLHLQPGESSYGLGGRASRLNLRGQQFQLWNTDPPFFQRGDDPLYYNIPFYLGVHAHGVYGVFWDNASRGTVDIGLAVPDELAFEAEAGELRYYLFVGNDVNSVLARYTELTGRITLPPLWSLGYHQSRFSYHPQSLVLDLAQEFRSRGIACDVLYLDIHYMDGFRVFTWDQSRFPAFADMIAALHAQGYKVVVIIDPGIKADPGYNAYRSGMERDAFLKLPDGKPALAAVWAGASHFPDFTSAAARSWWAEQFIPLLGAGVDGLWNDMCEPTIFTSDGASTLPDGVVHDADGLGGDHLQNHNVYGMLMGRASQEALLKHCPDKRPFNIIRAGYAGAQRYASSWTGDNTASWDHLRLSLSMTLNMGLSGAPMTGPDIGGFNGDTDGELYTRWLQAAVLMPYFRSHTALGTHSQEPWSFGQLYEVINRLTIGLRYRFLPYLYSVVAVAKEYGWPVIRPVFTLEPFNPNLRDIDDCYLVGDSVLVAPVLESGAVRRSVYLPVGEWYDYWTNELLPGGQVVTVPAPLERVPLFVRAGAALPQWPEMQFVNLEAVDTLLLRVYPGEGETVLYEDSGEGLAYEKGDYRWVYMTCNWDEDGKFVINRRSAGQYAPSYNRMRVEVVGLDEEPLNVRVDRQGAPLWFFDDGLLEVSIDTFQRIEIRRRALPSDKTLLHRPW
jgi:alpha-glucosidase